MPATGAMDHKIISASPKREASSGPQSTSILVVEKNAKIKGEGSTEVILSEALNVASDHAGAEAEANAATSPAANADKSESNEAKAAGKQIVQEDERAASGKTERRWESANERYGMKPVTVNGREYLLATKTYRGSSLLTTNLRPVAEPPLFDFEYWFEEKGWFESIEKDHDHTWGNEPGFKTARTDLIIQRRLFSEYIYWKGEADHAFTWWKTSLSISESEAEERRMFLKGLGENLTLDRAEVELELFDLQCSKSRIRHPWHTMDYEEKRRARHGEWYQTPAERREDLADEVHRFKAQLANSEQQRAHQVARLSGA